MKNILIYVALAVCVIFPLLDCTAGAGTLGKVRRATVTIYVYDKTGKQFGQGSGFFFKEYRHLITNYHVLGRASAARVKTFDGRLFDVESIVAVDRRDDLIEALVDMPYGAAPYLLPATAPPMAGESLMVSGSPHGVAGVRTKGKIIEIADMPGLGRCIVHDARAARGSSGGPVVDAAGEVIGIETAGLIGRPNVDFAIPVKRLSGLSSCYRELEKPKPPPTSNGSTGAQDQSPGTP